MLKSLPPLKSNLVLSIYRRAFSEFQHEPVIDIDKRIKHEFDMSIFRLEDVISALAGTVPPIKQNCYIIVLVKSGKGEKQIGKLKFPIRENTLYIIPAREVHSSNFELSSCSGYAILFYMDFFLKTDLPKQCIADRKVFKGYFKPYLYLDQTQAQAVAEIFENMLHLGDANETDMHEIIAVKILELLILCDRIFLKSLPAEKTTIHNPILENFLCLLDARYRENRGVSQYAAMLNIHPNHLNFLVKKRTGLSAKQLINNKIISESKYLLSNSEFIIKEVSSRIGFDDPNNFSSFFQKCTGNSPVIYRLSCPVFNAVNRATERKIGKGIVSTRISEPARQLTA
jgi:AraC family transcriptional activator of pobA